MKQIVQSFSVSFKYNIQFTSKIFNLNNETFKNLIEASGFEGPANSLWF